MLDTAMRWLGMGLCHQLPERSFFGGGQQLPVCARDTGIYVGFVVALLVIALFERGKRRAGMPPMWLLALGVAFVGLMAWDGVTSYLGMRETTNALRLATGLGCGAGLALVVAPILNASAWRSGSPGRLLGEWPGGLAWSLALPIEFAVVYWGGPLLGVAYPLVVAVCILVTFTAVNLVLVTLIPRFERRAGRLRELAAPVAIAFGLTVLELAAADGLRVVLLTLVGRG